MNTATQSYLHKFDRVFYELANKILSFLDFPSLMQILTVNTDFYNVANKYFKYFLVSNNLIDHSEQQLTGDHYLKLFRSFYSREVLVANLATARTSYLELEFTRYPRCSTYGVRDFAMGSKFTVFHLFNKDLIFLKTDEYLNPLFNMKNINRKNIRKNVAKFFPNSRNLFYLTTTGQLFTIFYDQNLPSHELTEGMLEITLHHPLKDCAFSYYNAVLLLKIPEIKPNPDNNSHDENNKQEEEKETDIERRKKELSKLHQDVRVLSLQDLLPQDFNAPIRLMKAKGLDEQPILDLCVSNTCALFLTDQGETYELDFSVTNNNMYMIFPYQNLKKKPIKRVWCGFNYFFALEQKEIPSIEFWTKEEIISWALSKGFDDYKNILKYENITGKQLIEADKRFLIDKLGMMREDLQVKFLNEVAAVSKPTYLKPKLWAWGNNSSGQLGLNAGHSKIYHPMEVPLPEFERDDSIEHVECGWNQVAILTRKHKIWMTEMLKKATKEKDKESEKSEDEGKGKKGKKSRKSTFDEKEKVKDETEKGEKQTRWVDITPLCQTLKDNRHYKIIKISLCKETLAVLGANLGRAKKGKGGFQDNTTSFSKFKGADHIYNRILWDKSLKRDEFTVGYEDRFLGILEIPFVEFSQKTDIPSHRIKYFKRNGEIVWDRVLKINKLIQSE